MSKAFVNEFPDDRRQDEAVQERQKEASEKERARLLKLEGNKVESERERQLKFRAPRHGLSFANVERGAQGIPTGKSPFLVGLFALGLVSGDMFGPALATHFITAGERGM